MVNTSEAALSEANQSCLTRSHSVEAPAVWLDTLFIKNALKQTVLQCVAYADGQVREINKAAEIKRLNKKQDVAFDEFAIKKKKIKIIVTDLLFTSGDRGKRREVYVMQSVNFYFAYCPWGYHGCEP